MREKFGGWVVNGYHSPSQVNQRAYWYGLAQQVDRCWLEVTWNCIMYLKYEYQTEEHTEIKSKEVYKTYKIKLHPKFQNL